MQKEKNLKSIIIATGSEVSKISGTLVNLDEKVVFFLYRSFITATESKNIGDKLSQNWGLKDVYVNAA